MATRRKNANSTPIPSTITSAPTSPTAQSTTTTPTSSPFLPTTLESILLSIYPLTLILGSLFSTLSPSSRQSPYNPVLQAHEPSQAPSYFAKKSNVFNVYFVKIGWVWITAAFFLFTLSHSSLGPPLSPTLTPRRVKAVLRYLAITTVWTFTTQWCFGPPIVDRGFTFTGGKCEMLAREGVDLSSPKNVASHAACKAVGGTWKGGHDISGHVFILIMGSAMLWLEILPAVLRVAGLREERAVLSADGVVRSAAAETEEVDRRGKSNMPVPEMRELGIGVRVALGVAGLSWWMLLMTAAYFHTWFEKFTGLVVAFGAIYVVYFLPRAVPALRNLIGMPGL
ncbi:hypothetical protein MBLNU457_6265t1 [Dothideomycetes sp. NU457]